MLARRLLKGKGVSFEEIRVDKDPVQREVMERRSGRETVPQVFAGDRHLGGYTDLVALDREGELDALLGLEEGRGL
ncbi:glutaredoxin [Ectothiorhodospira sp. PHS-1]|nr:glutaredoxin [Ectothiorhodospira sp. PHS-1]